MPCRSDYMEPNERERESITVRGFLKGLGLSVKPAGGYGDVQNLDRDTERLCTWCKSHNVTNYSLELQIWWRDHQIADQKREVEAARLSALKARVNAIKAKLTKEELDTLMKGA